MVLLFTAAAEATPDDRRRSQGGLGAKIGITSVLHHLGLGDDASSAPAHDRAGRRPSPLMVRAGCRGRPRFFLPVRVLSRLFRRLLLGKLLAAHQGWTPRVLWRPRRACRAASIRWPSSRPLRKAECRVDGDVAVPIPRRPGRADFPAFRFFTREESLAAA